FDDVITQFVLMERHARDEKTGLMYHGYDDSRAQKWADPKTGRSPTVWGRAMGWYAMGLVETLDFIPLDHPRRPELIAILQRLAVAGLGGDRNAEGRYRDGSYDYYVSEKVRSNDPKAIGPFIFASLEMER